MRGLNFLGQNYLLNIINYRQNSYLLPKEEAGMLNSKRIKSSLIALLIIIAIISGILIGAYSVVRISAEAVASISSTKQERINNTLDQFVDIMNDEYNTSCVLSSTKVIEDFAGNQYILVECDPSGYMIFSEDAGILVEYSGVNPSPYSNCENELYYGGPGFFMKKQGDKLVHTLDGQQIDYSVKSAFAASSEEMHNSLIAQKNSQVVDYIRSGDLPMSRTGSLNLYNRTWTVVDCADFFRNKDTAEKMSYYSSNDIAYSGYIAASMLLGYYDTVKGYSNLVNSNYMDLTSDKPNRHFKINADNGKSFTQYFLVEQILIANDWEHWSTGTQVRRVMNEYFSMVGRSSELGSYDMITPFFSGITVRNNIDKDIPVILFGSIEPPSTPSGGSPSGNNINAAVLVYGYSRSGTTNYFLVHYTWPGYSQSTINLYGNTSYGSMYRINEK